MKLFDLQNKTNETKILETLERIEQNQKEIGEALFNTLTRQVELTGAIGELLEKTIGVPPKK